MAIANSFSKGQALALFQRKSAALTEIAALTVTNGKFLVGRSGVWANDFILSSDLTEALKTPPAIGGTTPAAGAFLGLSAKALDTNTASVINALTIDHDLSSGNGANGIGVGVLMRARSTTQLREQARIRSLWTTATDASRVANLVLSVWNVASEVDVLTLAPTAVTSLSDTDASYVFGRTRIDSRSADGLVLSHFDMSSTSQYALLQTATGSTFLNAASGQSLNFRINNASIFVATSTSYSVSVPSNITASDTASAAVTNVEFLDHALSSGNGANGIGTGLLLRARSSVQVREAIRIRGLATNATDASRKWRGVLSAYDTAERDCIMWEASGSAPMLGFFGTAPVVRQTGYTTFSNLSTDRTCDANATTTEELADILGTLIEDLKALGLIAA